MLNCVLFCHKLYDSNNKAYLIYTISGTINNDFVDICNNYVAIYRSVNASYEIIIDISNISLYNSSNYIIFSYSSILGNILPAPLTAYGIDKIYDGNNTAYLSISGLLNNEVINYSAYYDSFDVGNNINITISSIISNSNYYLTNLLANANILPKLLIPNFIVNDKVYDGTTIGSLLSYSLSGLVNNDSVSLSYNNVIFNT